MSALPILRVTVAVFAFLTVSATVLTAQESAQIREGSFIGSWVGGGKSQQADCCREAEARFRREAEARWRWTEPRQAALPYRRTSTGFAVGVTLSAVVASAVFNGNICTGSGDYLTLCRIAYVGSVAGGAGLGALFGRIVPASDPPGRSLSLLRGAAVGALGIFVLSLPFCANSYEKDNPAMLCSSEGMPTAIHTGLAAAGGALIANFLTRNSAGTGLGFGVAPSTDGSASLIGRVPWR